MNENRTISFVEHIGKPPREPGATIDCIDIFVGDNRVGWIERRPPYCDRGHWKFEVNGVPDIDAADGFPRYYMDLTRAKLEIISWLNWRLWRAEVS